MLESTQFGTSSILYQSIYLNLPLYCWYLQYPYSPLLGVSNHHKLGHWEYLLKCQVERWCKGGAWRSFNGMKCDRMFLHRIWTHSIILWIVPIWLAIPMLSSLQKHYDSPNLDPWNPFSILQLLRASFCWHANPIWIVNKKSEEERKRLSVCVLNRLHTAYQSKNPWSEAYLVHQKVGGLAISDPND